jgi:hypothetical protein
MTNPDDEFSRLPLLAQLSRRRGLPLLPIYRTRDVAALFGVKNRAIRDRVADGDLQDRDLPGRARFFPEDLERFLEASAQTRDAPEAQPPGADAKPSGRRRDGFRARRST